MVTEKPKKNIWLCPVKKRNWQIAKKNGLFGFPKRACKALSQVNAGDLLVFYALRPTDGIVAVAEVTSNVFENNMDTWGRGLYPLRVNFEILQEFAGNDIDPIPLSVLMGQVETSEIRVLPFLRNVWITRITAEQYHGLKEYMKTVDKKKGRLGDISTW